MSYVGGLVGGYSKISGRDAFGHKKTPDGTVDSKRIGNKSNRTSFPWLHRCGDWNVAYRPGSVLFVK